MTVFVLFGAFCPLYTITDIFVLKSTNPIGKPFLFFWLLLRFSYWFPVVCVLVSVLLNLSCLRFIRLESIMSFIAFEKSQSLSFNILSLLHSLSSGTRVEQMLDFFTLLLLSFFMSYILFISLMLSGLFFLTYFPKVIFVCW